MGSDDPEAGGSRPGKTNPQRKMYKAAMKGDWQEFKHICDNHGGNYYAKISKIQETALHVAVLSGHDKFVQQLVNEAKDKEVLAMKTEYDVDTTLCIKPENAGLPCSLYDAAIKGDWKRACRIYEENPEHVNATINSRAEVALYLATLGGHSQFVENLVAKMYSTGGTKVTSSLQEKTAGNTAFNYAALSGNVKIAEILIKESEVLAMIRGKGEHLPIFMAAARGHASMVRYLYRLTKRDLLNSKDLDKDRCCLLLKLIETGIYDVALDMVKRVPKLATARPGNDKKALTALHALALKPLNAPNLSEYCIYNLLRMARALLKLATRGDDHHQSIPEPVHPSGFWNNPMYSYPNIVCRNLMRRILKEVVELDDSEILELKSPWNPVIAAAEHGNIEFISSFIASYPQILFTESDDHNRHTIFHIAILHRCEEIFKLIQIDSVQKIVTLFRDKENNNMLHLAAKLPPPSRLNLVPGAALQLQRQIMWFEEVKKVVNPCDVNEKNYQKETPRDVLLREHSELIKEGEKWMRDTANSGMLVAALVTTVVFAAALTVPGGNSSNGVPNFLSEMAFKGFAISDAISLISSASAVLIFSSILTSRYTIDDFLWQLPNKLILGLVSLFISIMAMMVAFIAIFYIVLNKGSLQIFIPVAVFSSLPILLFIIQHSGLFYDVIRSTYFSKSLFKLHRNPLFRAVNPDDDLAV